MEYLSDFQTALKWDVTVEQVRKGCIYGLVNGAVYKNGVWMIPENKERLNNFLRFIDGAESLERKNNLTRNEKKEKENGKTTVLYDNTKYLSDKVACERAIWKRFPALERVLYVASYASDNRKICSKDRKELVRLDKVVVHNDKRNHRHTYAYYQCPVCKRKYVSLDDARNIILLIQDKGPTRKLPTVDSRKTGKTAIPVGVTTNTGRRVSSQKTKKPTPAKQRKRGNEHTAQLGREEQQKYQEMFVNKEINALSCSTTFEMGVDVGDLETVYLRNMPPSPANYVQRAGRAGRGRNVNIPVR